MKVVKNLIIVVGGFATLFAVLYWMQGGFIQDRIEPVHVTEQPEQIESVQTVVAHYRVMEQTADAVGSIQSRSTTNIASKILATINSINVRPGDRVKKGDLLVSLDDRDLETRLLQAKNAYEAAKATYEQAQLDRQRYEKLLATNDVTRRTYDDAVSAERIALAKLEQAQEQINEAKVMLSYSRIYAPMDGTVIERFMDPGDLASPGKPIVTMYDPQNLRVEVAVREQLSGRLILGQEVRVQIDAINKEMMGTVEEIVPSADPHSRSVIVKVSIPKEQGVFPGMFGRIYIPLDPVKYLVIPKEAIRKVGQLELATIKQGNELVTRALTTGRRWNGDVEVLAGLSEGEEVVIPQGA